MNAFRVLLVAASDDNTKGAAYEFKGLIKKDATVGSTAIIGSLTKAVIAESVSAWDATVVADTEHGALRVSVTGEAETVIRWVAFIEMVEVAFYWQTWNLKPETWNLKPETWNLKPETHERMENIRDSFYTCYQFIIIHGSHNLYLGAHWDPFSRD